MDNTAKLSDIITELQALEGINQKADLKSALVAKGISVSDTDSMADLISKVNSSLYGSNIKSIQVIESSSSNVTSQDFTISSVNPSNTIVLIEMGLPTAPTNIEYDFVVTLLNSTTVRVLTGISQATPLSFKITVIEFNNVKSIQTGTITTSSSNIQTVTVNAVNISKYLVVARMTMTGSNAIIYTNAVYGVMSSTTSLQLKHNGASTGTLGTIYWQLIEFN